MLAVISVDDLYVDEDAGTAEVSLSYTGTLNSGSIDWVTSDGTAGSGSDYTASSGTLSISGIGMGGPPSGSGGGTAVSLTVSIPISEDTLRESGETFYVTISNASGNSIGDDTGRIVIVDNDSAGRTRDLDNFISSAGDVLHSGAASLSYELPSGLSLEYSTLTYGAEILDIRTEQPSDSVVPSQIKADLYIDGAIDRTIYYDTAGLALGDDQRFVFDFSDSTLASGTYPWQLVITETIGLNESVRILDGVFDHYNRRGGFVGDGWQIGGLDRLAVTDNWATVLLSNGATSRFPRESGGGPIEPLPGPPSPTGEETYVPLLGGFQEYTDGSFLWVQRDKTQLTFDSSGNLLTRIDPNGNETGFSYDSIGNLTKVTFQDGREVDFGYGGGSQINTITDWAGRVTTLTHGAGGELQTIQSPDPDGIGAISAAETDFEYWSVSGLLKKHQDALGDATEYSYDTFGRLSSITSPGCVVTVFAPQVVQGAVASGEGTVVSPADLPIADPSGTVTNAFSNTVVSKYGPNGGLLALTNELGNTTTWERGVGGFATKMTLPDPDGAGPQSSPVTSYEYDSNFNLTKTIFPDLSETEAVFDSTWNVPLEVTDPLGNQTRYMLDARGNVITIQSVIGLPDDVYNGETDDIFSSMSYTAAPTASGQVPGGMIASLTDPLGTVTKYTYGTTSGVPSFGQVISVTDAFGTPLASTVSTGYGSDFLSSSVTDPLGSVTSYSYDDLGRLTATVYPDPDGAGPLASSSIAFTYDALNRIATSTDPLGNVTTHEYDERGNLLSVTLPDPDGGGVRTAPVISYTYDLLNRQVTETDALGNVTSIAYDAASRVLSRTLPDPDGAGSLVSSVYSTAYDFLGRPTSDTDPLGNVTSYTYDTMSRVVSTTFPDPDGGGPLAAPVYTTEYDDMGQVVSQTDPLGSTTSYSYDEFGRIKLTTLPDLDGAGPLSPQVSSATYDAVGNLVSFAAFDGTTQTHAYDELHRRTATTFSDPDGGGPLTSPVLTWSYDLLGNLIAETSSSGAVTSYLYDKLGRLTQTTQPDPDGVGPLASPVTVMAYDLGSRVISTTDPLGNTTEMSYDNLGLLTSRSMPDPDGAGPLMRPTTTFAYDAKGQQTSLTDALGETTSWQLDNLGRLITETDPRLNSRSYAYDEAGHLVSAVDRNGLERIFTYDNLGRVVEESWKDGVAISHTMAFSYDAMSNPLSSGDSFAEYSYVYDVLGRVTSVLTDFGSGNGEFLLSSEYNASSGVLEAIELQSNAGGGWVDDLVESYSYDGLNRISAITQAGKLGGAVVAGKRVDLGYDSGSRVSSIDRYSSVNATPATSVANSGVLFDSLGRISSIEHEDGATSIASYDLVYDAGSRITEMSFSSLAGLSGTTEFSYDANAQLVGADHSYIADEAYGFDLNGNRSSGTSIGTGNRLLSDATWAYTYDDEGNLTERTRISSAPADDKTVVYAWDHRNRLLSVTNKDNFGGVTQVVEHSYDVYDRRVSVSLDADGVGPLASEVVRYVYRGADVLVTSDGTGEITQRVLHGPAVDQVFAIEDASTGDVLWALTDQLGSVRDVIDSTGAVANHLVYDSFGNVVSETSSAIDFLYGFTGRERDKPTGLNYHRARYYASDTGRWLSQDPIGFAAGDENLYRYVGNQATSVTDPTGLWGWDGDWIEYGIGGMLGLQGQEVLEIAGQNIVNNPLRPIIGHIALVEPTGIAGGVDSVITGTLEGQGVGEIAGNVALEVLPGPNPNKLRKGGAIIKRMAPPKTGVGDGLAKLPGGSNVSLPELPAGKVSGIVPSNAPRGGTYKLKDVDGNVQRTGRSKDLDARRRAHANHPDTKDHDFEVDRRTDVYAEQRGREQIIHDAHPEALLENGGLNKIRGISPKNPRLEEYLEAGRRLDDG